jgi:DNA transposition AAA+ family ATPase
MSNPPLVTDFIVTKEHRRFVEFCDACRRYRYIGLCYGQPGIGKTWSARVYTNWDRVEQLNALWFDGMPPTPEIMTCHTVFYTASVVNTPGRIEKGVAAARHLLSRVVDTMEQVLAGVEDYEVHWQPPDRMELLIVDEADRLKTAGLEQIRDIYDHNHIGLVLIGMPGIEKRLSRYAQLYSRVGFVHQFKALSIQEMHFIFEHKWQQMGLSLNPNDFADAEATSAIIRITGGNFRLIQRLFSQIERIMEINQLQMISKEVVETARENLVIGP